MRIAISLETNNGLNSAVARHFGRCLYFALADVEGNEVQALEVIDNPHYASRQVGQIPTFIHEQKANVILSGGMGGQAIQFFKQFGIEAATGASGTVRDALQNYLGGEIHGAAPCAESIAHGYRGDG